MSDSLKWGLPFFMYQQKNFCYFWSDKKTSLPYIAFYRGNEMEHPALDSGDRKKIKVFTFDPEEDLPMALIDELLSLAKALY